jgi:hypothetical protein
MTSATIRSTYRLWSGDAEDGGGEEEREPVCRSPGAMSFPRRDTEADVNPVTISYQIRQAVHHEVTAFI